MPIQILEDHISRLNLQLEDQEKELSRLKELDSEREKLVANLQLKWSEMARNWSEELRKSQDEVVKLKDENSAAKQVCCWSLSLPREKSYCRKVLQVLLTSDLFFN